MKYTVKIIMLLFLLFCIGCNSVEKQEVVHNPTDTFTLYEIYAENIVYEYYPSSGATMRTVKSISTKPRK